MGGYLLAILVLGILVLVHEAGHFVVARLCKMRVEKFSIFFGPAILKFKRGETTYQLGPIPMGGYVQIAGMNPHDEVAENDPNVYPNRPAWQRFATIFAGPGTNYLFAVVIWFCLSTFVGTPRYEIVAAIEPGSAAEAAGLMAGDRVLSINGASVTPASGAEFVAAIQGSKGEPITLGISRKGEKKTVVLAAKPTPVKQADGSEKQIYRIGVGLDHELVPGSIVDAAVDSVRYPVRQSAAILGALYRIVTAQEKPNVGGPVEIVKVIKQESAVGWTRLFELMAMLNVYLGLFNLLPLPALDGGRLVFLVYEMATRRRPNPRFEAAVHTVGFMLLFGLMILVTVKDLGLFS